MGIKRIVLTSFGWALLVGGLAIGIEKCKADGIPGLVEKDIPGTPEVWIPFETKEKQLFHLKKLLPEHLHVYPFYWNGKLHGDTVIPEGPNYWYYYDKEPCLYAKALGMPECREEIPAHVPSVDVPEPMPILLLGIGLLTGWLVKRK